MKKNKVLVIGWDAADWKAINPMIEQGYMPHLKKMMMNGCSGKLATLDPPLSPMLWTSIATGKRPYKHGILGFAEPRDDGSGIQPVLNTSRKCKAIWNILTQLDQKTHVVGWWPSHPAEPINGTAISNFYQKAYMPKKEEKLEEWPMMDSTIHPKEEEKLFALLRIHPLELTAAHLLPFLPNGKDLDQSNPTIQKLIDSVRKIIADCCTIHSSITYILENKDWDFAGVYYDAIDHFGHGFMRYHPPQQDHIPDELYDGFYNVVAAGYRLHDMFLGRLLKLAGKDATVLLISDHGFHPDHLRLKGMPKFPAAPALEHSLYGIFVAQGPGIKRGSEIYGASLLDITPTILSLYDLPVAKDMDGKALLDIYDHSKILSHIESWEDVKGKCGMHPPHVRKNQHIDQEALEQLIELGYIERPHPKAEVAVKKTVDEINFWLATSYLDGNIVDKAIPILENLYHEQTDQVRYGQLLVNAYERQGRREEAQAVLKILRANNQLDAPNQLLLEGKFLLTMDKVEAAIDKFNEIEHEFKDNPDVYLHLGQAHLRMHQYKWAKGYFDKALKIDAQNHFAFNGLGACELGLGNHEGAAKQFISSLSHMYYQSTIHFSLGQCLEVLGDKRGAAQAYKVALELEERVSKAEQESALVYEPDVESVLSDDQKNGKKEIIVVSGLPRSGTSMMMQMLEKGGLDIFTDKLRGPDESNPKGYYEHEKIKSLTTEKSVLDEINEGEVVKIIAQLLFSLPIKYAYKIVFMKRHIDEVIQSQEKMLQKLQTNNEESRKVRFTGQLKKSFNTTLGKIDFWSKQMPNVEVLYLDYQDLIEDPVPGIEEIVTFVGKDLNQLRMASVIDKSLYREKIK